MNGSTSEQWFVNKHMQVRSFWIFKENNNCTSGYFWHIEAEEFCLYTLLVCHTIFEEWKVEVLGWGYLYFSFPPGLIWLLELQAVPWEPDVSGGGPGRIVGRKRAISAGVILGQGVRHADSSTSGSQHLEFFLLIPVGRKQSETLLKWSNCQC